MKIDERITLLAAGEASAWDTFVAGWHLAYSVQARKKLLRYTTASSLLRNALADTDEDFYVRIKSPKMTKASVSPWLLVLLLGVLASLVSMEWDPYVKPTITSWKLSLTKKQCASKAKDIAKKL